jgi:hypothetical protein
MFATPPLQSRARPTAPAPREPACRSLSRSNPVENEPKTSLKTPLKIKVNQGQSRLIKVNQGKKK